MDLAGSLRRGLAGDPSAIGALVAAFTPVVQARAARALARRAAGRQVRQEVEDMTQEVLCLLFQNDGKILRAWDATRGLSLLNYVGLVAEREVGHVLASGRRSPWALDPTDSAELETAAGTESNIEERMASQELFDRIHARLRDELSPKGLELFRLLVTDEVSIDDAAAIAGLSTGALYTWRSRLLKRARELRDEIEATGLTDGLGTAPAKPSTRGAPA